MSRATGLAIIISCGIHAGLWGVWMQASSPRVPEPNTGSGALNVTLAQSHGDSKSRLDPQAQVSLGDRMSMPSPPSVVSELTRAVGKKKQNSTQALPQKAKQEFRPPPDYQPATEPFSGITDARNPEPQLAQVDSTSLKPLKAQMNRPSAADPLQKGIAPLAMKASDLDSGEAVSGERRYEMGAEQTPFPVYPQLARRRGWQGTVVVGLLVSPSGLPLESRVVESSGYALLDEAARSTLESWELSPSRAEAGQWLHIPVVFDLRQD